MKQETRNLLEEIKHNELIGKRLKMTCINLNYVERLLILASAVTSCFISAFASLVGIPIGISRSAATIKICVITAVVKKSINKKKRKKHDKTVLLGKAKLNAIEVLICKALIDSYISRDEFVSVNNVLREYNEMKEEIAILKMLWNILYKYG